MSEGLTAKYRPKKLDDLVGQRSVVTQLKGFFESGHLPQAYIFTGIRGTGKTSTARIFANMVDCAEQDINEIDGASNTGVDDVRRLIASSGYAPMSKSKVYIIDECHMLSRNAWNALLKTIEEPLGDVYFILVTTEYGKIPDTIKSRCHTLNFRSVSFPNLKQYILEIGASDEIAELAASHADGSVRDAVMLYEKTLALGEEVSISEALGVENKKFITDLLTAVMTRNYYTTFTLIEQAVSLGFDFIRVCRFLSKFAVDLSVFQNTGNTTLCEMFGEFINANTGGLFVNNKVVGTELFFKLLGLEQDLNYRNDKDVFLTGIIEAFKC